MLITIKQDSMAYEYKGGTKGITLTGTDKGGVDKKTQSSKSLSSGVITDATNVGNPNNITSSDIKQKEVPGTFKFNPAMEQRILAAKDRQAMRIESRRQKLVGGSDGVKSKFTPTAEEGSKLYEKNLATQNRLNKVDSPKLDKKNLKPVSTGGSTVTNSNINNTPTTTINSISGATSIKPQAAINKPVVKARVIDAYKKNPPASSGSYTLSSTKDKPISGTEGTYTPHAMSTPEGRNTIAKQVGAKNPSNFARAHEIEDEKERDKAENAAVNEDDAIFNLLFSKPSIKL